MDYFDFTSDDLSSFGPSNYYPNAEGYMYDNPYYQKDVPPNTSTCVVRPFCQQPPRIGDHVKRPAAPTQVVTLPLNVVRRIPCSHVSNEQVDPRKYRSGLYTIDNSEALNLPLPKFYETLKETFNNGPVCHNDGNQSEYQRVQSDMYGNKDIHLQTSANYYNYYDTSESDFYHPYRQERECFSDATCQNFSMSMTGSWNYNNNVIDRGYEERYAENFMYEPDYHPCQPDFVTSDYNRDGSSPYLDAMGFRPFQNQSSCSRSQDHRPVGFTRPYSSGLRAMEEGRQILEELEYINARQESRVVSNETFSSYFQNPFPSMHQEYSTTTRKTSRSNSRGKSRKPRKNDKVKRHPQNKTSKKTQLLPISEFLKPAANIRLSTGFSGETRPLPKPNAKATGGHKKSYKKTNWKSTRMQNSNYCSTISQGCTEYSSSMVFEPTSATVPCNSSIYDCNPLMKISVNKESSSSISDSVTSEVKFTPMTKSANNQVLPYKAAQVLPVTVVPNNLIRMASRERGQTKVQAVCPQTGTVKLLNLVGTVNLPLSSFNSAKPLALKLHHKSSPQINEGTFTQIISSTSGTCTQSSDTLQNAPVENLNSVGFRLHSSGGSSVPNCEGEIKKPQKNLCSQQQAQRISCESSQVSIVDNPLREDFGRSFPSVSCTLNSELNESGLTFPVSQSVIMTGEVNSLSTDTELVNTGPNKSPPIQSKQFSGASNENCQAINTQIKLAKQKTNKTIRLCSNVFCRLQEHDPNRLDNKVNESDLSSVETLNNSSMVTEPDVNNVTDTNRSSNQPQTSGSLDIISQSTFIVQKNMSVRKSKRLSEKKQKRAIAKRTSEDEPETAPISKKLSKSKRLRRLQLLALKLCKPLKIKLTRIETDPNCKQALQNLKRKPPVVSLPPESPVLGDLEVSASNSNLSSTEKNTKHSDSEAEQTSLAIQEVPSVNCLSDAYERMLSDSTAIPLNTRESEQRSVVQLDRPNLPAELCQTIVKAGSKLFKLRVIPRQKPHCRYCKMFSARWDRDVSSHVAQSHPYRCSKCFSTFSNKEDRRSHAEEHRTELHHCALCQRAFTQQYHINQHFMSKIHNQFLEVQRNTAYMLLRVLRQHLMDANCRVPSMKMLGAPGDHTLRNNIHNLRQKDLVNHYYKDPGFQKLIFQFKKYLKRITLSSRLQSPKQRNGALRAIGDSGSQTMLKAQNPRSLMFPIGVTNSHGISEFNKKTSTAIKLSNPSSKTSTQRSFVLPSNKHLGSQKAPGADVVSASTKEVGNKTATYNQSEGVYNRTSKSGMAALISQKSIMNREKPTLNTNEDLSSSTSADRMARIFESQEATEAGKKGLSDSSYDALSSRAQTSSPLFNLSQEDDLFLTSLLEMSEECETEEASGTDCSCSFLHHDRENVCGSESSMDLSISSSVNSEFNQTLPEEATPIKQVGEQKTAKQYFCNSKTDNNDYHSRNDSMISVPKVVRPLIDDQMSCSPKFDGGHSGPFPSAALTKKSPVNPQPVQVTSSHHQMYNQQLMTSGAETWSISRTIYQHQSVSLTPRRENYDWQFSPNMCNNTTSLTDLSEDFMGGMIGFNSVRDVSYIDNDDNLNWDISEGEKLIQLL